LSPRSGSSPRSASALNRKSASSTSRVTRPPAQVTPRHAAFPLPPTGDWMTGSARRRAELQNWELPIWHRRLKRRPSGIPAAATPPAT
jgi:hypothetical protein